MQTKITELFEIKHPIIQGGMHYVSFAELASAVSNAGGLGVISALTQKTPSDLSKEIKRCFNKTSNPFGVNLTFLPTVKTFDYSGYIDCIIENNIKIVETAGRNPQKYLSRLKDAGVKIIHKCTSIRHALKAQELGCDAVSIDGFECAGHPGEDDITNMILLPIAAEKLKIPFVASGGIANGKGLVASISMGAEGINMGTRFIVTKEAPVHNNVKVAILRANELDTCLIMRSLKNTERVIKNRASEQLIKKELSLANSIKFQDIFEDVVGVYPKVMIHGAINDGVWSCGMVAGLIKDILSCKTLIDRIMFEATELIKNRLNNML